MRIAILLLLAIVLAALGWWYVGTDAPPALPGDVHAGSGQRADAATGSVDTSQDTGAGQPADVQRTEAELPPPKADDDVPDDATWVYVTVRDLKTKEPVAGADVHWANSVQSQRVMEDRSMQQFAWYSEPGRMAKELGWHTISDEQGRVRVWYTKPELLVTAVKDDRYGQGMFQADPNEDLVVYLEPDRNVRVRVRDATGAVARGVAVGVKGKHIHQQTEHFDFTFVQRQTDDDGIAAFTHLQTMEQWRLYGESQQPYDAWEFAVVTPGDGSKPVRIAADNLPSEPVELRLDGSGHLEVRLTVAGKPASPAPGVHLVLHPSPIHMLVTPFSIWPDDQGRYRWRHLALGTSFAIGNGQWQVPLDGPQSEGEVARRDLRLEDHLVVAIGRALDEDGEPIPEDDLRLLVHSDEGDDEHILETDAHGRLLWLQQVPDEPTAPQHMRLLWEREGQPALQADLGARALSRGLNDLGDMRLRPAEVTLAGRVVGDLGERNNCHLSIEQFVANEEPGDDEDKWQHVWHVRVTLADDGTFVSYHAFEPGRYRIRAGAPDLIEAQPVEFQPGQRDVRIEVRRGSRVFASCVVPEGMRPNSLRAFLIGTAPEQDEDRAASLPMLRGPNPQFRWWGKPPGTYALEIRLAAADTVVQRIEGIVLPDGASDPRLKDIDLRAAVNAVRIQIETDAKNVEQLMLFPQPQGKRWRGVPADVGDNVVALPANTHQLLVAASGVKPQTVTIDGNQARVHLEAWPTAEIEVVGLAGLLEGTDVTIGTRPVAGSAAPERVVVTEHGESDLSNWLQTSGTWTRGTRHSVPFDGRRHTVNLTVFRVDDWTTVEVKNFSPKEISTSGPVRIVIPPEEAARIAEALRPK